MFGQYFGNNWTILEKSSYDIFVQCIYVALDNIWIISGYYFGNICIMQGVQGNRYKLFANCTG